MFTDVLTDTAREAAVTGEDNSGDSEVVDDISGPTVKHVDDNGIRWVLEEEVPERLTEKRGVDRGTCGHVCVGYYIGLLGESVDSDGKGVLLVSSDCVLEMESVGGSG
jgi:hypothetical protein